MTIHYLRQFFSFAHLREDLRAASEPFADLAQVMDESLPDNPEKTVCLRKLLEAKDCAVRAMLFDHPEPRPQHPHLGSA